MSLRDDASPESAAGSPSTTTVTAAFWAAVTAAEKPLVEVQLGSLGLVGSLDSHPGA